MKKLIVGLILIFAFASMSGQNTFKYQINAKGGINVSKLLATGDKIDSIKVSNDTIYFYQGASKLFIAGTATGAITASDTAAMLTPYIREAEVAADYVAVSDTSTMLANYALDSEVTALEAAVYDTIEISSVVPLLVDTVPIFVFGAGTGVAADTAVFSTSALYGAFYNEGSDTLVITQLNAVMVAGTTPLGTDTLSIQLYWNDSINVTGVGSTTLNSAALGINSVRTGTIDTSFANSKIPPDRWVFLKSPGVVTGRKPNMLIVTISGYKIPRY